MFTCECASTVLATTPLLRKASSISEVIRIFKHLNIYLLRLFIQFNHSPYIGIATSCNEFQLLDFLDLRTNGISHIYLHSACQKAYLLRCVRVESFIQTNASHEQIGRYVCNKVLL